MHGLQAAACGSIEQAKCENGKINCHVPFTNSDLVTKLVIANKSAGCQQVVFIKASCQTKVFDIGNPGSEARIVWLLTEQKKGTESELVTKRTVGGINDLGREGCASF